MKTVLVIGGYGGFGARVALLLARGGFRVTVAGRTIAKAEAFCRSHPALPLTPLSLDRTADLLPTLRAQRPWLVVDAAGPFQGGDYRVAQSCIDAGCHYADLADGRAFVCGITRLDAAARAAGVCVVSGVSSVPALTGAVADRLAGGLDRVSLIDVALSTSNRASGSRSVTEAILSYVGKPVALWRGGAWRQGVGWQELERLRFTAPDKPGLRRHVAICDVPDLELLPPLYPGQPAVRFRAGTEIAVQNIALWVLSWPVRWGWVRSLGGLTGLGLWVQKLLRPLGGDRSAMQVIVKGWSGERAIERRWTVYADRGDGPWIPALAVPLLAERLQSGAMAAGACTGAGLLALEGFERMFAPLAITTHTEERPAESLYRRIMGADFDRLPSAVKAMHQVAGDAGAHGEAEVTAGGPAARLIARLFRLPVASARVPLQLWMQEQDGVETWHRSFGDRSFASRLEEQDGLLVERFGPLRFAIALVPAPTGLGMALRGWSIGRLPMPSWLGPTIHAGEEERDGLFHFDVDIALPLIGRVVRYRGWLRLRTAAASALPATRPDLHSLPA